MKRVAEFLITFKFENKKQKEEFRKYIIHELNQYGYCPSIQHKRDK